MSVNQLKQLSVRDASLNLRCESLVCANVITPSTPQAVQTVNQATSVSTPVDCGADPSRYVIVNTQSSTAGASQASTFTFQNTNITTTSVVLASILNYSGSLSFAGLPALCVKNITTDSCTISIMNCGNTAFAGTFKIYVEIIDTSVY
jgi:hypothetical protein